MEEALRFYKEMSNYELYDSYLTIRTIVSSDTAILMTMLFAYLGVAYFVASKLTRFQAAAVSVLYSVFQFFWIYAIWDGMINMSVVVLAFTNQQYRFDAIQSLAYTSVGLWTLAWALSLAVFIQSRRMADDSDP